VPSTGPHWQHARTLYLQSQQLPTSLPTLGLLIGALSSRSSTISPAHASCGSYTARQTAYLRATQMRMVAWLRTAAPSLATPSSLMAALSCSLRSDRRSSPCPPLRASMSWQCMVARMPYGFAASFRRYSATSHPPPPYFPTTRQPSHSHATTSTTCIRSTLMCDTIGSTGSLRRAPSGLSTAPRMTWWLMPSPRHCPPPR